MITFLFLGGDKHQHLAAFQLGGLFNAAKLGAGFGKALHHSQTDVSVGHLAAPEADAGLDLIAGFEELLSLLDADVEVGDVDLGGQTDFLDIHNLLVLAGFLFLFGLFKAELAVVHDAAHGGLCLGGDLYQVQTPLDGGIHGLLQGNDAQLGTVAVDQSNFLITNLFVDLMLQSANV